MFVISRHQYEEVEVKRAETLYLLYFTTEFVPCPVFECKGDYQKIVQQPADLTTLSANLAKAAVSFIKHKACESLVVRTAL